MELIQRIKSFVQLGKFLKEYSNGDLGSIRSTELEDIVINDRIYNPWFTEQNIKDAIKAIGESLTSEKLNQWIKKYPELDNQKKIRTIGVVTAGNIPLVGFHDFITVLISGNKFLGKLSSKDNRLLKFIVDFLVDYDNEFASLIEFTEDKLENFDAVIATGSNNTARYFEYYFGKYPHIIRKNRNSAAVLNGDESKEEIEFLANDIFSYFGLGCRSVSKLFIPADYSFDNFFENIVSYGHAYQHNKYANNYDYNKSVYLMNQIQHLDNGFLILKEDEGLSSPIGVLFYQHYKNIDNVKQFLELNEDQIQCVVSNEDVVKNTIPFGKAQQPELWDYADNVDTLSFLLNI
jgi:Acyl-CoA reductase (LuxC)